jgi:tetratricopeptide (TPR) repeat protein
VAEDLGWPARARDEEPTRRVEEPTRRTTPSEDDAAEEATRRTRPVVPPPLPTSALTPPAAAPAANLRQDKPAPPKRRRKVSLLFRAALVIMAIVVYNMFATEFSVRSDARKVAAEVSTRDLDQLGDLWKAHAALDGRSSLQFGTAGLERALVQRTLALAEGIIGNYRMGLPNVREAQWTSARNALRRAVPAAPDNLRLLAALRYSEGHLHRINGEANKSRQQDDDAQRELSEAVALFREAAELRPDWPDPFLGLARVFISGLDDVDRGADALEQAQQRGHTLTERETGLLADGYRSRGNSFVRIARQLEGMPQESDYLARAIEAYQRALDLYVQSDTLPKVSENIRGTQRLHDQTQQRLDELTPPTPDAQPAPEPVESSAPSSSEIKPIGALRPESAASWA